MYGLSRKKNLEAFISSTNGRHFQGPKGVKTLNFDRDISKSTWDFDLKSEPVSSVYAGQQKRTGPPLPMALNFGQYLTTGQ